RNLTITGADGPNNDGIIIDSSLNVIVEDCDLRTSHDGIALKSGMAEDGKRVGMPTENVILRRIKVSRGSGGITIGSDVSGGVRNVFAHDCEFDGVGVGIRLKAARGHGGTIEDVTFQNIAMRVVREHPVEVTTEFPSFVSP